METKSKKRKVSLGTILRRKGFDLTEYDRSTGYYHVRCSQCQSIVINGYACHERGCPNDRDREEY